MQLFANLQSSLCYAPRPRKGLTAIPTLARHAATTNFLASSLALRLVWLALLLGNLPQAALAGTGQELVVDAVVATVDDKPITLSELSNRMSPRRNLSLTEASQSAEAGKALDAMIFEKILEEEATSKRISASDADIEEYINEVSRRNNLSRPEFEKALAGEGRSLAEYKQQVRTDILRTRLASSVGRGGVSISDADVDRYIEEHPELTRSERSLKLRQIVVSSDGRDAAAIAERTKEITTALDAGEKFEDIARKLSDGSNAADGGLIGIVAEKDLNSDISGAVLALDEGEWTKGLESATGVQIFFVEQRLGGVEDDKAAETLRGEVRQTLQQQRGQEKLSSYFTNEIFKNHAIEKKL